MRLFNLPAELYSNMEAAPTLPEMVTNLPPLSLTPLFLEMVVD